MFVRLIGAFEVRDSEGCDCTPRGAKARALLAMLCQTPDRRRTRRWLESKLWSDRGAEQASGSLRQALMELRKALGAAAETLVADRDSVRLTTVETDIETDAATATESLRSGREFLEGIDIIDPAFLAWLKEERVRVAGQLGLAPLPMMSSPVGADGGRRPPLVLRFGSLPEGTGKFIAHALAHNIVQLVKELAEVDVYGTEDMPAPEALPQDGLALHIEATWIQGRAHMMLSLIAQARRKTVWSQRLSVGSETDIDKGRGDVPALIYEAAEAVLMQMPQLAETEEGLALRVNALMARAITAMFSFDARQLQEADRLLEQADRALPSGRISAWRSLVRQIMYVERVGADRETLESEADAFARHAVEIENGNPLVLALVSYTRVMVDENPEAGTVLALNAVKLSPFNPFGYWSESAANLRHERHAEALASARRGIAIAARSPFAHSWEMIAGLSALRGDQLESAVAHFEAAHYRSPNFRAPVRHLAYLYLELGSADKARRALRALLQVEPDFDPYRLLKDDYPATTLRRNGMAERHAAVVADLLRELPRPRGAAPLTRA